MKAPHAKGIAVYGTGVLNGFATHIAANDPALFYGCGPQGMQACVLPGKIMCLGYVSCGKNVEDIGPELDALKVTCRWAIAPG